MQDRERRIIEILRRELELYDTLETLVKEQVQRIDESDIEGLMKVISKKQTIISEQDKLNEELERLQEGLSNVIESDRAKPSLLNFLSKSIREDVEKLIESIKNKILKILEIENASREKLSIEVEKVREALKSVREGKRLINKYYGNPGSQEPKFIDQVK